MYVLVPRRPVPRQFRRPSSEFRPRSVTRPVPPAPVSRGTPVRGAPHLGDVHGWRGRDLVGDAKRRSGGPGRRPTGSAHLRGREAGEWRSLDGGLMLREGVLSRAGCVLFGLGCRFLMSAGPDDPPDTRTVPPPIGDTGAVMAL